MGRTKLGVALAGVIVMLLGVVTVVAMQGKGDSNHVNSVVSSTSDKAPTEAAPAVVPVAPASSPTTATAPAAQANGTTATTNAPAKAPASATPTTVRPQPSVQEIQQIIAGLTAQVQSQAASGTPLTTEQVDAQLRAMLKQLGISY
jgi:hypothetical protein